MTAHLRFHKHHGGARSRNAYARLRSLRKDYRFESVTNQGRFTPLLRENRRLPLGEAPSSLQFLLKRPDLCRPKVIPKSASQGFLRRQQMVLPGFGNGVACFAQILEIELDGTLGIFERALLTPSMGNAPWQIGDLRHIDLIFGTPRNEDLKTTHQFDFPSCRSMITIRACLTWYGLAMLPAV